MSDRLVSWLRTVVPVAWSALVAWLVSLGAPDYLTTALGGAAELLVVPIVVGAVYPIARTIETRLPDWLTRVLLGSAKPPTYRRTDH
ncbi:hypothetical protein [Actinokineospora iranica]|uniref:Uncharacterized protein n=1 Tax=Actinokineospora iranica TaxID=1271860 RepID=A0A1G6Y9F2_9PSEU|nr:hypothetical protein [Actinokineospora iranica]SDD86922.1 hypothetical protein SAMN05216174_12097 [Actinokineospora iranica]